MPVDVQYGTPMRVFVADRSIQPNWLHICFPSSLETENKSEE